MKYGILQLQAMPYNRAPEFIFASERTMQMDETETTHIRESIAVTLAAIGYGGYTNADVAAADDQRLRQCFESLTLSICDDAAAMTEEARTASDDDASYMRAFQASIELACKRLPVIAERFRSSPSPFRAAGWSRLCAAPKAVDRLIQVDRELLQNATALHDVFAEDDFDTFVIRSANLSKNLDYLERLTATRAAILLPYLI